MGIFMPPDISGRIAKFMDGKLDFPFVKEDEVLAAFYIFGKDYGVAGEEEARAATDLAKRAVEQAGRDVRLYSAMPQKLDSGFTRENYTKRQLQIVVDSGGSNADQAEISRRVAGDPTILSDCFAQHVAYHKQKFFFELFQPFRADQLPSLLKSRLEGRMLLLGFNVQDRQSLLPFKSSLEPFFAWMSKV
jgi:hypothetical protein